MCGTLPEGWTFVANDYAAAAFGLAFGLALEANRIGGTAPAVLNAANEVAVEAFLNRRIPFPGIAEAVEAVLTSAEFGPGLDLDEIREADGLARAAAFELDEGDEAKAGVRAGAARIAAARAGVQGGGVKGSTSGGSL